MSNTNDKSAKTTNPLSTVIAHMMTPGVVQIPGDISVSEAALLLEREQAPCLLVKDTDAQFGLMTPTDIVKKVVAQGLEPHDIEVRTIMTRPVQFIEYDQALADASVLMMATGAPLLIVTKQNQPVGVLTAQDLMLTPARRRTKIPSVVSVVGRASAQGLNYNAMIIQLNHVGALVESTAKISTGTNVVLAFSISGQNTPLTIRGKVLASESPETEPDETSSSTRTWHVDIQFTDLSSSDLARIRAWALQTMPPSPDRS
ncbi:MAG: CBS domain-containing protein [Nitrospira sp.]|jgi:CBS domain-containing protein/Tfp pilus assembly protein PilZ|nr:MAG: CBS domain-containing protein [Nitrospira sp.]